MSALLLTFMVLAELTPAVGSDRWQQATTAARRAGYDFADVRVDHVFVQRPGTRVVKADVPQGATVLHPRTAERIEDSLIDYAVDEKYGGDRAIKLAIKAVNRLLKRQRQELEQLRAEKKIAPELSAEVARRLLQ